MRSPRMTRWLKRISLALAGIMGLLVLALVVLVVLLERGQLDGPISRQLTAALGRDTVLSGPVDIGLGWQPSVTIGPLTIANPPGIEGDPFLHLPRAEAAISLGNLVRGRIVLPRVIVTG